MSEQLGNLNFTAHSLSNLYTKETLWTLLRRWALTRAIMDGDEESRV